MRHQRLPVFESGPQASATSNGKSSAMLPPHGYQVWKQYAMD
jgi:hypothetical protein